MKVFKSVRPNRNETLLEILGAVATAKTPLSRLTIQNRLKVRIPGVIKSTNREYVYSNIHTNTNFLERKDFLRIIQTRARKEKLYDVTVKGAMASLFSSFVNEANASKLLEIWRKKDWGPRYDEPFRNLRDVQELRKIAETYCLHGGSLEDVSEDILRRSLRDPEEVQNLIHKAKITLTQRIDKEGKYSLQATHIPGSVQTMRIHGTNGSQGLAFIVAPDAIASKILNDLIENDPSLRGTLETYFLTILSTLSHDLQTKGEGSSVYYYFPDSRTAVLTLTLPENVASLLHYPEKIVEYTRKSFDDIVKPFLQNPDFVQGKKSQFYFGAFRYDPASRDLLPLPKLEIIEKAHKFLEQIRKESPIENSMNSSGTGAAASKQKHAIF